MNAETANAPAWATPFIQNSVVSQLGVRVTQRDLLNRGWTREPGAAGKCSARYTHRDGWRLEHCGHPTALWPYLLLAPTGERVLMGVLSAEPNIRHGHAWKNLAMASLWVDLAGKAYLECTRPHWMYGRPDPAAKAAP